MCMFGVTLINFGNVVGDNILMLHRVKREINSCHCADLACPKPPSIDDVFSVYRALIRHHVPCTVGPLVGLVNHAMRFNCRPAHPCGLCICVGCS